MILQFYHKIKTQASQESYLTKEAEQKKGDTSFLAYKQSTVKIDLYPVFTYLYLTKF